MIKGQALPALSSRERFHRHSGQALVEFTIVATALLVPLFFMISYVAKYHDMQAATIQAARYAAWERTVYFGESDWASGTAQKTDDTIRAEIKNRFFSGPGNGFESAADNPLWTDHAGVPILGDWSEGSSNRQTPGTGDFVLGKVTDVISVIGKVLGADGFKLDMNTLYTATVTATPRQSDPMARMFSDTGVFRLPALSERHILVANGWSANGPDFVKKQTESLALTSVFQRSPIQDVIGTVQQVAGIFIEELKPDNLKLGGDIQVDLVPSDRVSGGNAPAPTKTKIPAKDRMGAEEGKQKGDAERDKDAMKNTMANFDAELKAIQDKINACNVDKQNEMWGNYYGNRQGSRWVVGGCSRSERYCHAYFLRCWEHRYRTVYYDCERSYNEEFVKEKPGSSWTPIFDADSSCHAGLDARIEQLKTNIDNEEVIKKARTACQSSTTPDCEAMNAKLRDLDNQLQAKRNNRSRLDVPFNSCNCSPGPTPGTVTSGTTCVGRRDAQGGPAGGYWTQQARNANYCQ